MTWHGQLGPCPMCGDQRWDVTIARHGARRPKRVIWKDMRGCYAWEAIEEAFAEHDWPEEWECGSEPFRVTVRVTPASTATQETGETDGG